MPESLYEIDVIETNAIEGGIEIFARAWKDGVQLGFGEDGSVDIERFKVYNPPVLVGDPQGDIIIPASVDIETALPIPERRLREDPVAAIQQALVQTVRLTGKTGTQIIVGKRGNTTSTFYAGAGDGSVYVANSSWSTARGASSGTAAYTDATRYMMADKDASTYTVARTYFPFDTSSIPDTDDISSATFSVDNSGGEGTRSAVLILTTTSSETTLTGTDFAALTLNSPSEGTASRVALTSIGYKDFIMNATGIGWISKTGYTKLGLRLSNDVDDSAPTVRNYVLLYCSEQTGTTNDPVLVVTHAAGGGGGSFVPQVSFIM